MHNHKKLMLVILLIGITSLLFSSTHTTNNNSINKQLSDHSDIITVSRKYPDWYDVYLNYIYDMRSLYFKTDLDSLVPPGKVSKNAAIWFKDFTKKIGRRYKEVDIAYKRAQSFKDFGKVLTPDDPLLMEAEPWCNMTHLRLYPDIYCPDDYYSKRLNVRLIHLLARSFVARGYKNMNEDDFKRAIRLGRLLHQMDIFTYIESEAIYCIQIGTLGIYNISIINGDMQKALLCSNILGEIVPLKYINMKRSDLVSIQWYYIKRTLFLQKVVEVPESDLSMIIKVAKESKDRRFSIESLETMRIIRNLGTDKAKNKVVKCLVTIIDNTRDPIIKAAAKRALNEKISKKEVAELWRHFN